MPASSRPGDPPGPPTDFLRGQMRHCHVAAQIRGQPLEHGGGALHLRNIARLDRLLEGERDVAAVAGYVNGRSGQRYSLVALINHDNANAARPALDQLVEWVALDR